MAVRRSSTPKVRKISLPTPGKVSRRAQETLKHLSNGWLPVEADLLVGIQANIANEHYADQPELLIDDLKKDPGLFFTVSKKLKSFASPEATGFDPISLLAELEKEQLETLFHFDPGTYSLHRANDASPSQELLHELTRIGGVSAETLAEEVQHPSSSAYSGALFRQLGLSLLAWNYPKLFAQALSLHKTQGKPLEKTLREYFEITPHQIGTRFARELEMSREIKQSLLLQPDRPLEPGEDIRKQLHLNVICQLSELFARAQEPQFFPEAEDLWVAKESALIPSLGKEVFQTLHEKAEEVTDEEVQATDFGDLSEYVAREQDRVQPEGMLLPESNPHLSQCPEEVQRAITAVHRELERTQSALDAIRLLLEKGIPETGAVRGCLYLQRKQDYSLQAALRFGSASLPKYQKFLLDGRNGIIDAVHARAPFVHDGTGVTGNHCTQVRGGLSEGAPPGVLYIEISAKALKEPNYNPIITFHVIRAALQECLKQLEEGDRSRMSFY
ncbi:HDOD domain-containing protein [bacterium]|nr:HDOD domain-containing protein [bacterium]